MGNVPSWLSKWARSPRQDRRVVENGKFVELGQVHVPPAPPVEELEVNTALEVVHEPAEKQEGSTGANVLPNAQEGSSAAGLESSGESADANPRTSIGTVEEVSNPSVSTPEGPSISEASQAELEPLPEGARRAIDGSVLTHDEIVRAEKVIDAVAEHEKGSQTVAEIAQALEPLPGSVYDENETRNYIDALAPVVLTAEESDALAETLRLPEPTEDSFSDFIKKGDDIPF